MSNQQIGYTFHWSSFYEILTATPLTKAAKEGGRTRLDLPQTVLMSSDVNDCNQTCLNQQKGDVSQEQ